MTRASISQISFADLEFRDQGVRLEPMLQAISDFIDKHGHLVGDQALVTVATLLKEGLRKYDVVGRYGGEEFALLLPETNLDGARVVAERYRGLIEGLSFTASGLSLSLTASFGVVSYPRDDIQGVDDLIRKADQALYGAKAAGRNKVSVSRP